jgi:hypothetical protein
MTLAPSSRVVAIRELLSRHLPYLRFDSRERYFPLAVDAWTDCLGHRLRRADGAILAERHPSAARGLALSYLGAARYADGAPVRPGDAIISPGRRYRVKARRLQADPRYADRVYARAQTGADGRLWLQYRWFYFFNDFRLLRLLPVGVHEGDWEMVQFRLDRAGAAPDLALYTHHRSAQQRPWSAVPQHHGRPVVYVARGSHGCYFTPGTRWTGAWFDHADGRLQRGPQTLVVMDDDPAVGWTRWPGAWGGTRPRAGLLGKLDGASPNSPGAPAHRNWSDPSVLLDRVPG